jgi:hypothetical protein
MEDSDATSYSEGLATPPEENEDNADKWQVVFYHTERTFSPIELFGAKGS